MATKSAQRHAEMLKTAFGDAIIKLMNDPDILEIMVNPDGKLWTESLTSGKFFAGSKINREQRSNIIKLVAATQKLLANSANPEISCELPETGERFQGWLPPVVSAPTFTIRKRAIRIFTLDDYVEMGSLSSKERDFLKKAVQTRQNILVAGGTASGKTTFTNALLNELKDSNERVVVLEDLPELQVNVTDSVALRTSATKSMRDLVRGTLRMRPDRIIIGEVKDGAALELLKAWNTGHPGGICTIHANNPLGVLLRLEDLIHEVVTIVPKHLIEQSVDIIVFMKRDDKGRYKIQHIDRLIGIEHNKFILKPALASK